MEGAFQGQFDEMQLDIDNMGGNAAGGPIIPLPGMPTQQPVDPAIFMQTMMQKMMQPMMAAMMSSFQQAVPGAAAIAASPPAAYNPQGGVQWRQDPHMANVRFARGHFVASKSLRTKRMSRKSGVLNSSRRSASATQVRHLFYCPRKRPKVVSKTAA